MFVNFPNKLKEYMQNNDVIYYYHSFGISPEKFMQTEILNTTFTITSTSKDYNNQTFVASIEGANKIPLFAI